MTSLLTFKNLLSFIIGVCVVGLALIPLLVPVDHLSWTRWQVAIAIFGVLGFSSIFIQAILQSHEDRERERREGERDKREIERDKREIESHRVLEEIAKNLAHPQGLAAGFSVSATVETLRERVAALAYDLLRFLKEKGPDPEVHFEHSMTTLQKVKHASAVRGPWVEAIHYGYEALFKDRVRQLLAALRGRGLEKDMDLDDWIEPAGVQTAEKIQKLAEQLLLIASKMEVEEIGP